MQEICDIFFTKEISGASSVFRLVMKTYGRKDPILEDTMYSGFMGLNIRRLKGVTIVKMANASKFQALNVPIRYRDGRLLSEMEAVEKLAEHYGIPREQCNSRAILSVENPIWETPLYWTFTGNRESPVGDPVEGGAWTLVDRLDGHIWTSDEYDEYWYDYNNHGV